MSSFARALRKARGGYEIPGVEGSLGVAAALRASIEQTRRTGRNVSDLRWLARTGNNPFSRALDRLDLDIEDALFLLGLADVVLPEKP